MVLFTLEANGINHERRNRTNIKIIDNAHKINACILRVVPLYLKVKKI